MSAAPALWSQLSEKRYDIEWGGFLTNHLVHGVFALQVSPHPFILSHSQRAVTQTVLYQYQ